MSEPAPLTSARPLASVEAALASGVRRGERSVSTVRIIAAALVFASIVATDGFGTLLALDARPWITTSGLLAAAGLSAWDLLHRHASGESRRGLWLSVTLDAAVVTVALLPVVFWPRPAYPGLIQLPAFYFFPFTIALSGLRLDRGLVTWSVLLNGTAAAAVLFLDLRLNGAPPLYALGDAYLAAALFLASIALGYAIAGRTRTLVLDGSTAVLRAERARMALGVYVSETVADQAMAGGELKPGGERRQVAVLFSDLRGFTAYSDRLQPERLVGEINAYLDRMVEVIRDEGGVVDKYIGDAIMVVFGIPEARGDDATRAVRAAARMQQALEDHNVERAQRGLPPLKQGIGVHYGPAIAGNIGSADRLQYTVMGTVVNLASRLESATKTEGVSVLLSAAVVDAIDEPSRTPGLTRRGALSLRGADEPLEVYSFS